MTLKKLGHLIWGRKSLLNREKSGKIYQEWDLKNLKHENIYIFHINITCLDDALSYLNDPLTLIFQEVVDPILD